MSLKGKKIVLGITGSIAAYKSCLIIRGLIKRGAEVQVVITPAGKEFITPITLSALTHKPVVSEFFSQRDGTWNSHVDLGLWADAMLIAPCTAATMGKMANGIADNMLITTYLSMKAPVFIAPAMDLDMYRHPSTQHNMQTLLSYGNRIIEPASGFLASGLEGKGRMEEPEIIVDSLDRYFDKQQQQDLSGKNIMITAGPTYEKIDPVRFIGNYSSGKMGFALAEECRKRGAHVTLIAGPVALQCDNDIRRIDVESCEEMYEAATHEFTGCDAAILCAAVADFRSCRGCRQEDQAREGRPGAHPGSHPRHRSSPWTDEAEPPAHRGFCPGNQRRGSQCRKETQEEECRLHRAELHTQRRHHLPHRRQPDNNHIRERQERI